MMWFLQMAQLSTTMSAIIENQRSPLTINKATSPHAQRETAFHYIFNR
jgi:hypothetical protein